jgi:GT2 family glycosyltransferase
VIHHEPSTWVVLVNYNGLDDTRRCLASLLQPGQGSFSCVVVDNASANDPGPVLMREFPEIHYVRSTVNTGWSGGNNIGARYALERRAGQVILLNNDTVVRPDFIPTMKEAARRFGRYGVLGPVIRRLESPYGVMTDGCTFNRADAAGFFERQIVPPAEQGDLAVTPTDIVNGCCMMVSACVFDAVGPIDDRFFLIHEESDFCLRAGRAGFGCGVFNRALVWHKGSSSFARTGSTTQRYYDARNLGLLLTKHPHHRPGTRGRLRSGLSYLRYLYHRACHELEARQPAAAVAVAAGLADALTARFGPRRTRPRKEQACASSS